MYAQNPCLYRDAPNPTSAFPLLCLDYFRLSWGTGISLYFRPRYMWTYPTKTSGWFITNKHSSLYKMVLIVNDLHVVITNCFHLMIVSLSYRTQYFVKIDSASFKPEHNFKFDRYFSAAIPIYEDFFWTTRYRLREKIDSPHIFSLCMWAYTLQR